MFGRHKYEAQLKVLADAETVAFGPVGFAAKTLPVTQAYEDLATARDPALRSELEKLLKKAKPAGKVYAAFLLGRLDPDAGREAWQRLVHDGAAVNTFSGCIAGRTTLAAYAAAQLDAA
jgi:hypothetical protein